MILDKEGTAEWSEMKRGQVNDLRRREDKWMILDKEGTSEWSEMKRGQVNDLRRREDKWMILDKEGTAEWSEMKRGQVNNLRWRGDSWMIWDEERTAEWSEMQRGLVNDQRWRGSQNSLDFANIPGTWGLKATFQQRQNLAGLVTSDFSFFRWPVTFHALWSLRLSVECPKLSGRAQSTSFSFKSQICHLGSSKRIRKI